MELCITLLEYFISLDFHIIDSARREEDNFIVTLLIFGAIFFTVTIIITVILCLILTILLFVFVSAGILSVSFLVGLQQKSVSKGFKTMFLSITILICSLVCTIGFWMLNNMYHFMDSNFSLLTGGIIGVITGIGLGLVMFEVTKRSLFFVRDKFRQKIKPNAKKIE